MTNTRRKGMFVAAFLMLAIAPATTIGVPIAGPPWAAWRYETPWENGLPYHNGIAIDSRNQPHVVFSDGANDRDGTIYAERAPDFVSWKVTLIHPGAITGGIAIDSQDHPHVVTEAHPGMFEVTNNGSGWHLTQIDSHNGSFSHIVLDHHDRPHVIYNRHGYDGGLTYATIDPTTGAWVTSIVDGWHSIWSAIAVDSNDLPHVLYGAPRGDPSNDANWHLFYATLENGAWNISLLRDDCLEDVGIAIDAHDHPHVSCAGFGAGGLGYGTNAGSGWQFELVDNMGRPVLPYAAWQVGYYTDIAVDSHAQPHISYWVNCFPCDSPLFPGQMHYATKGISGWSTETVDSTGMYSGAEGHIALDHNDRPHFAYPHVLPIGGQCTPATPCGAYRIAEPAVATIASASGLFLENELALVWSTLP